MRTLAPKQSQSQMASLSTLPQHRAERMAKWSEQYIRNFWRYPTVQAPTFVSEVLGSQGTPLADTDRSLMATRFNYDFSNIRVHADERAAVSAERLGTAAYSAGGHVVFGRGQYAPGTEVGRRLLAHELAHVVQNRRWLSDTAQPVPSVMLSDAAAEQDADAWTMRQARQAKPVAQTQFALRPSIAEKILKFAAKQLEKRTIKTVSRHIARHARRIGGRAIHSVFKNPREIRSLLQRMVLEATEIAARYPRAGSQHVIEEGGYRITRQATGTPGKFRVLIQKVFDKDIGTHGERVLRVVLDQTGRIVTAFPTDRLAVIGLTAAGIEAFTEGTARAGEAAQAQVARAEAARKAREERVDLWEWVPFVGDIWGGSLNEGEYEMLQQEREIATLIQETIDEVEKSEQRSLSMQEHVELEKLIRAAIASPLVVADGDPG